MICVKRLATHAISCACATVGASALAAAPGPYVLTDIGTFGGKWSTPYAINDNGIVVGQASNTGDERYTGFRYTYGTGVFEEISQLSSIFSSGATAINSAGQIGGQFKQTSTSENHGFYISGSTFVDLGTLGGPFSTVHAINDSGVIIGSAMNSSNARHAYRSVNGGPLVDLGTLGGPTSAGLAINNVGTMVGQSSLPNNSLAIHAVVFRGNGVVTDLGNLDGSLSESIARDVNDSGVIAGHSFYNNNTNYHAMKYANGSMQDIGALAGQTSNVAVAINNGGEIVGNGDFDPSSSFVQRAAYFDGLGGVYDLNALVQNIPSGWYLDDCFDINNGGQILCTLQGFEQGRRAVLLTPVPEPGCGALTGSLAMLLIRRRRRE